MFSFLFSYSMKAKELFLSSGHGSEKFLTDLRSCGFQSCCHRPTNIISEALQASEGRSFIRNYDKTVVASFPSLIGAHLRISIQICSNMLVKSELKRFKGILSETTI